MNGGNLVVKTLECLGVEYIFGYIGATIAPVFDALIGSPIKLIVAVDEVGATHMADGYARVTGKPGVVLATSGPGATNLVTGIATAYMDSVPMLAITANVPAAKLGKDSFQEVDITGIVTPVTKYAEIVKSIDNLEYEICHGYVSACSGRNAPVLIDITVNVLADSCEYKGIKITPKSLPKADESDLKTAASLIASSSKPLILAGGGARGAEEEIIGIANKIGAPIATTMRFAGAVNSPRCIGTVGSAAPFANNRIYRSADLIIAFGTRFSDRQHGTEAKGQKHIHIDIDPAELNKIVFADVALNGDCKDVATRLMPMLNVQSDWLTQAKGSTSPKGRLNKLTAIVGNLADKNIVLATDVGVHQVAVLNALKYIPRSDLVTSAGLGTMGFGIGASIGAYFGSQKPVLLIIGDGGFNMCARELATAVKYKVPLTAVIVNNRGLKMIINLQNKDFDGRHIAVETPQISYKLLARSMGAEGKVLHLGKAEEELTMAIGSEGVKVFEFLTR